jgi:hypothetical protein
MQHLPTVSLTSRVLACIYRDKGVNSGGKPVIARAEGHAYVLRNDISLHFEDVTKLITIIY